MMLHELLELDDDDSDDDDDMDDAFEHWLTESENPWNEFLSHVDRHQVNCARVDCLW